jgi:hypothetical protein
MVTMTIFGNSCGQIIKIKNVCFEKRHIYNKHKELWKVLMQWQFNEEMAAHADKMTKWTRKIFVLFWKIVSCLGFCRM